MCKNLGPGAKVAVVLGAGLHNNGTATQRTINRAKAAARLAATCPEMLIILSGNGPNQPPWSPRLSEAHQMQLVLTAHGVAQERQLIEDESVDTAGNAILSYARYRKLLAIAEHENPAIPAWGRAFACALTTAFRILEKLARHHQALVSGSAGVARTSLRSERLAGNCSQRRLFLVTSPFHMERALIIFGKVFGPGWDIQPYPSEISEGDELKASQEAGGIAWARNFFAGTIPGDAHNLVARLIQQGKPRYRELGWLQDLLQETA